MKYNVVLVELENFLHSSGRVLNLISFHSQRDWRRFSNGACLVNKKAGSGMKPGSHGSTFGGNPLAMSIGNAVLDIIFEKTF